MRHSKHIVILCFFVWLRDWILQNEKKEIRYFYLWHTFVCAFFENEENVETKTQIEKDNGFSFQYGNEQCSECTKSKQLEWSEQFRINDREKCHWKMKMSSQRCQPIDFSLVIISCSFFFVDSHSFDAIRFCWSKKKRNETNTSRTQANKRSYNNIHSSSLNFSFGILIMAIVNIYEERKRERGKNTDFLLFQWFLLSLFVCVRVRCAAIETDINYYISFSCPKIWHRLKAKVLFFSSAIFFLHSLLHLGFFIELFFCSQPVSIWNSYTRNRWSAHARTISVWILLLLGHQVVFFFQHFNWPSSIYCMGFGELQSVSSRNAPYLVDCWFAFFRR